MIIVKIEKDEINPKHRWLVVERPNISIQQIKIESEHEKDMIINALQQSVYSDAGKSAASTSLTNASAESTSKTETKPSRRR